MDCSEEDEVAWGSMLFRYVVQSTDIWVTVNLLTTGGRMIPFSVCNEKQAVILVLLVSCELFLFPFFRCVRRKERTKKVWGEKKEIAVNGRARVWGHHISYSPPDTKNSLVTQVLRLFFSHNYILREVNLWSAERHWENLWRKKYERKKWMDDWVKCCRQEVAKSIAWHPASEPRGFSLRSKTLLLLDVDYSMKWTFRRRERHAGKQTQAEPAAMQSDSIGFSPYTRQRIERSRNSYWIE